MPRFEFDNRAVLSDQLNSYMIQLVLQLILVMSFVDGLRCMNESKWLSMNQLWEPGAKDSFRRCSLRY